MNRVLKLTAPVVAALMLAAQAPAPVLEGPLAEMVAPARSKATAAQAAQITKAITASPALKLRLERLARQGKLKGIEIVAPNDRRLERPFAARAVDGVIIMTAPFIEAQMPRRYYDVVQNPDVLPDNLVFILAHLAQHIDEPFTLNSRTTDRERWIDAKLKDEAKAYIVGWNDMMSSVSPDETADVPVPMWGSTVFNFRYRQLFLQAEDADELFDDKGRIAVTAANVTSLADGLQRVNVPDFD